jgi:phospholipid transport system substrate-binding protein
MVLMPSQQFTPTRILNRRNDMVKRGMASLGIMFVLAVLLTCPAVARGATAKETIERHVNRVLDVLRNSSESKAAKEKKIVAIADEIFDYNELSRRTLANQWSKFTPQQQSEFRSLFGRLLSNVYLDRIMQYSNEKVVFGKESKLSENTVEVQSEIATQSNKIPIMYRMIDQKGEWKVYDVVIEGVSLVVNYRNQFRDILSSKSPEDLLKTLREKVKK